MNKDMIFFAENGLTSTSANHIANLCKEFCKQNESILNNVTFYDEKVALIGTSNQSVLHNGVKDIKKLPTLLKEASEAKSLIAWLREAIKAKTRLLKEIEEDGFYIYLRENNVEKPEPPKRQDSLTEDEYYANLTIKERNRYYSLETEASVLGKYIHPDGTYAEEREKLAYYIQNPHKTSGNGRDTVIYSYTPTMELSEVDDMFFQLQKRHREIQASLNSIKYQCEQAVIASKAQVQEEYNKALQKYNAEYAELTAKVEEFKTKKLKEIGDYKIIIPDSLKDIYEKVSKLGK